MLGTAPSCKAQALEMCRCSVSLVLILHHLSGNIHNKETKAHMNRKDKPPWREVHVCYLLHKIQLHK